MNKTTQILTVLIALAILLPAGSAYGTAINSAQSGNWTDTNTWSGGVVPTNTNDVTITNNCTVTITDVTTHYVKSLTIQTNAVLTHGNNSTDEDYKVILNVASNLTLDLGGEIDVDTLGYDKGTGPGAGTSDGGGAYGGRGGTYGGVSTRPGMPYGSVTAPTRLGSGGGNTGGGAGGGAIVLNVGGVTTNNGHISANGGTSAGYDGAGAGGAIYITTGVLEGNGTIRADGGSTAGSKDGGGGGAVASRLW